MKVYKEYIEKSFDNTEYLFEYLNSDEEPQELIRCKDCKWHRKGRNEKESWNQCIVHCRDTTDMNYCAWAERKEEL
ncbi:hypothetical protein [Ruminobacter sp.]|uniref:hypothetical protein n=1 Tax=Ruminobacter sp. TaxID=2774296 RepID=UPI003864E15F